MATLSWREATDGIAFTCEGTRGPLAVADWAMELGLRNSDGTHARVGTLLRFLEDGLASEADSGEVVVPWPSVAQLTPADVSSLGLPPPCPYMLRLDKNGLLSDAQFQLRSSFATHTGRPVLGAERVGALLKVGGATFTLLDPAFTICDAAERLSDAGRDLESRAPWLAIIQALLPAEAIADPYLRQIRLLRADALSVLPYRNTVGELEFKVVPARARVREALDPVDDTPEPERVLPEAREDDWNRHFRALTTVRRCHPAGSGVYVVASPALQKALEVVKGVEKADPAIRLAFAKNPRAFLREHMSGELREQDIESVFWESAEYGARVRDVGLWQPKVLPYVKRSGEGWLPEEMGLRIGDRLVKVDPCRLDSMLAELEAARNEGRPSITFDGAQLPVTDEAIAAVRALVAQKPAEDVAASATASKVAADVATRGKICVLIDDNLDAVQFERPARAGEGQVGLLPSSLGASLFDFQVTGLRWLQELWVSGASGGLLADDMGLGKTVQALTFLAWAQEQRASKGDRLGPILIAGPTGLLKNWRAEHDRHLLPPGLGGGIEAHGEGLRLLRIGGAGPGHELATGLPALDVLRLQEADWVLTTYETLRDYEHSFARVKWGVVVLDEAQKVKNPTALMTEAAKALDAEFAIALTGTPVENHLADLWCIVDTVRPGRLGSLKSFVQRHQPDGQHSEQSLTGLKTTLTQADRPPLMMRRLKEECLEGLPPIQHDVTRVVMPPVQAQAYDQVISEARAARGSRGAMLQALHAMRAVSLHPLAAQADGDTEFINASARLAQTFAILDALANHGEKALVFVEALAMQGVLAEILQRRYRLATPPLIINGGVEGSRRKSRADDFQARSGFDVMILSPRAGGVGLTITAANHVIHLSRWWNPAVEDQATDRVYRIGQDKPVTVHIPLAVHPRYGDASFDNKLHALLERKRGLSRSVLAPPAATQDELENLYEDTVGSATVN